MMCPNISFSTNKMFPRISYFFIWLRANTNNWINVEWCKQRRLPTLCYTITGLRGVRTEWGLSEDWVRTQALTGMQWVRAWGGMQVEVEEDNYLWRASPLITIDSLELVPLNKQRSDMGTNTRIHIQWAKGQNIHIYICIDHFYNLQNIFYHFLQFGISVNMEKANTNVSVKSIKQSTVNAVCWHVHCNDDQFLIITSSLQY